MSSHVSLPEAREALGYFLRRDLLEAEDAEAGDDDAEDVYQGQGQAAAGDHGVISH